MISIPKAFDDILSAIRSELKGKTNPKTGKAYTDSDFYALATAAYKKKFGNAPEKAEAVVAENVKVFFNSYAEVVPE